MKRREELVVKSCLQMGTWNNSESERECGKRVVEVTQPKQHREETIAR